MLLVFPASTIASRLSAIGNGQAVHHPCARLWCDLLRHARDDLVDALEEKGKGAVISARGSFGASARNGR